LRRLEDERPEGEKAAEIGDEKASEIGDEKVRKLED